MRATLAATAAPSRPSRGSKNGPGYYRSKAGVTERKKPSRKLSAAASTIQPAGTPPCTAAPLSEPLVSRSPAFPQLPDEGDPQLQKALQHADPGVIADFLLAREADNAPGLTASIVALLQAAGHGQEQPAADAGGADVRSHPLDDLDGGGDEENQPAPKRRKKEEHVRKGSASLCNKRFNKRHAALVCAISREDASLSEQQRDLARHLRKSMVDSKGAQLGEFLSLCAEDEVANRIAIDAILKSSVKDALETQILAQVERKEMQWYEQVALFKVGRYSDAGWNLLRGAMEKHVDLSAPSTMRRWINIRCVPDPSANTGGFATVYKPDAEHAGRPIPMGVKVENFLSTTMAPVVGAEVMKLNTDPAAAVAFWSKAAGNLEKLKASGLLAHMPENIDLADVDGFIEAWLTHAADNFSHDSAWKKKASNEQVATLLDPRVFGHIEYKLQSCSSARPAMKLSGKEDELMMLVVSEWWNVELAEDRCWHLISCGGKNLLVRFKNRPAGDYHAVCAFLKHQGAACQFPCIWCEAMDSSGKGRSCTRCQRFSCHHTPFNAIHPSILQPQDLNQAALGAEPEFFATSVDASHALLKPRREGQATAAEKAAGMQAAAAGAPSGAAKRKRAHSRSSAPQQAHGHGAAPSCAAHTGGAAAMPPAVPPAPSPLDPKVALCVHPQAINEAGQPFLVLPKPDKLRTDASMRACGEIAAKLGGYVASSAKGKVSSYVEVLPEHLDGPHLRDPEMAAWLEETCTSELLARGVVCVDANSSTGFRDTHGQEWRWPKRKGTCNGQPGWEAYLKFCRKGMTGVPMTDVFDITDLKPESLHAVIKSAALLSDLGEALGWNLPEPVDLQALLLQNHGWYKPQTGYDGSTAIKWAETVHVWGKYLEASPYCSAYIAAVQAMNTMLHQVLSKQPQVAAFKEAAEVYHRIMLTTFPKASLRVYDHAMLVHVPDLLKDGPLLDGSSWFLEALNKVWKNLLLYHTNNGGGAKPEEAGAVRVDKHSPEGRAFHEALKANAMDWQAMKALWVMTMPKLVAAVERWGKLMAPSGVVRACLG